jgi:hypothetical protein
MTAGNAVSNLLAIGGGTENETRMNLEPNCLLT